MIRRFFRSFAHAGRGIRYGFRGRNFKVQVACAIAALVLAAIFHITRTELVIVILLIALVLSMEATNTVAEEICNKFHPEEHPHIALIKDLAAGAVLIAAAGSLAIGFIVFWPYVSLLF